MKPTVCDLYSQILNPGYLIFYGTELFMFCLLLKAAP